MSLRDLNLKTTFEGTDTGMVREFYIPCLKESKTYDRAVGYFTSHGLNLAAKGIAHLAQNGGKMRLVCSPALEEEDYEAIQLGYKEKFELINRRVIEVVQDIEERIQNDRIRSLSWLINQGLLEIKLAVPVDQQGRLKRGIFHEKVGIFSDPTGNSVAFIGSANETTGGLVENFECTEVFWSWDDNHGRVAAKIKSFNDVWEDRKPGLKTVEFPDEATHLLSRISRDYSPQSDPAEIEIIERKMTDGRPTFKDIQYRDYQTKIGQNWFKAEGKGLVKLATGCGKTVTALWTVTTAFNKAGLKFVVIVCPYKHLVDQWFNECQEFGIEPIKAYEYNEKWMAALDTMVFELNLGYRPFGAVITTTATFRSEAFQTALEKAPLHSMIIADEVHRFTEGNNAEKLPQNIKWRMGLSATPEDDRDEGKFQRLVDYFGPILEPQVGIREAIAAGVLCEYEYFPTTVSLSDDECENYEKLSAIIASLLSAGGTFGNNSPLDLVARKRNQLIAKAEGKILALEKLIADLRTDGSPLRRALIYCGEGKVNPGDAPSSDEEEERYIDSVVKLCGNQMGLHVDKFVAATSLEKRSKMKERLAAGQLDAIVAIGCLDEGVDVPAISDAIILASKKQTRQYVQRRGRILRRFPGKGIARIFDLIVIPPADWGAKESLRNLVRGELERLEEFASAARNQATAVSNVLELKKKFSLLSI